MKENFSRRLFFRKSLSGIPALMGIALLAGSCSNAEKLDEKKDQSAGTFKSCDDFSGLTPAELEVRTKFNYVEKSKQKSKECKLCALFIPPKEGMECGGCTLIKGPIRPEGNCIYFAAKPDA